MKIKTSELSGPALDWAVAQCERVEYEWLAQFKACRGARRYSTDWSQGGPIIEREGIRTLPCYSGGERLTGVDAWRADLDFQGGVMVMGKFSQYGETCLIAAMRCYVTSKLGDSVEVPGGLLA